MKTSSASPSIFGGVLEEPKIKCTVRYKEVTNAHGTLQVVAVADSVKIPLFHYLSESSMSLVNGTLCTRCTSVLGSPSICLRTMWRGKAIAYHGVASNSY